MPFFATGLHLPEPRLWQGELPLVPRVESYSTKVWRSGEQLGGQEEDLHRKQDDNEIRTRMLIVIIFSWLEICFCSKSILQSFILLFIYSTYLYSKYYKARLIMLTWMSKYFLYTQNKFSKWTNERHFLYEEIIYGF